MAATRVRPRIRLRIDEPPDELMERLRRRLPDCPRCTAVSVGRHVDLSVPLEERRIWSPHLDVTAEDDPPAGTVLHGRFGPRPQLWTFYMFLAFGLGFSLLVGLSWGYAQWVMDTTPWALLSLPITATLGALLYLAALIGQRLGAEQMDTLSAGLEELVTPE
jgi:hypothetical protein